MTKSYICSKWWYKISKSRYLIRLIRLEILCLRMWVLIIWILFQRLEVAKRILSLDLSQKLEPLLLPSILNLDWKICLIERRYIYMPKIQYTSYSFNIATLVVSFSELKISYLIRTMSKVTINNSTLKFIVSTWL